jgi:hypothetical protein
MLGFLAGVRSDSELACFDGDITKADKAALEFGDMGPET